MKIFQSKQSKQIYYNSNLLKLKVKPKFFKHFKSKQSNDEIHLPTSKPSFFVNKNMLQMFK